MFEEIEELNKAIEASPDNVPLRMLVVRKMKPFDKYLKDTERHLEQVIRLERRHKEAHEMLIEVFYRQGKNSAVIVLGEELLQQFEVSPATKLLLSKAYLDEGDVERSKLLYSEVLAINASMTDEKLDQAFRLTTDSPDSSEDQLRYVEKPKITFKDVEAPAPDSSVLANVTVSDSGAAPDNTDTSTLL